MRIGDFAKAIVDLFPPYRWDEATHAAWAGSVTRECRHFPPEVRQRAFDELVRKHKGSTPHVARVLELCIEAKRWKDAEDRKGALHIEGVVDTRPADKRLWDYSPERTKTVYEALRTPLAKRALKEGWHLSLRDFVRIHGALPKTPAEIKWCVDGARGLNEGIGILQDRLKHVKPEPEVAEEDTWVPLGAGLDQALLRLGMSMLAKRDEVAKIIDGDE